MAITYTTRTPSITFIAYEDNPMTKGNPVPYWKINATKSWLKHYHNYLMLDFFVKHETDWALKRRAEHELQICQRKMDYMEKHGNYDKVAALKGAEELKKQWSR